VPNVMKSENLNLLELSGPNQACYGTPYPLYIPYIYDSRTLGVNCRVAVLLSFSSFNLVLRDRMERCSLPPLITMWHARICVCVGSKEHYCMCVIRKGNKTSRGATLSILLRKGTLWTDMWIYYLCEIYLSVIGRKTV
jgi:hypothetical protein